MYHRNNIIKPKTLKADKKRDTERHGKLSKAAADYEWSIDVTLYERALSEDTCVTYHGYVILIGFFAMIKNLII